jgi:hypothetical protein
LAIRLDKPWQSLPAALTGLRGNLGVFQFADASGDVIYIGFAGGGSLYGLKGEVRSMAERIPDATEVRWEVNTAYHSRFRELLSVHNADFGELPKYNVELNHRPGRIGRLRPG